MAKNNFRGMPGGMNQAAMMKQAQKMQQEMLRMQQEQEAKTFTAKSGGGMVSATVNGKHELVGIEINPEAVDPDDVEMLQDMIIAAVTEAMRTADNEAANHMSRLTGGMNLGGLFGVVAKTIVFSNEANPSWTGDVVNTGTIKFAGYCKNAVQLGGIAGYMQGSTPVITNGKFINTGEIICTGEYDSSYATNGIGGIAGISEGNIDNAQVFCTIEAPSFPCVGMITGSARTETNKVTNCAVGGKYLVEHDEDEDATIETKITSSNYYKYIYGKSVNWSGIENYDGNTYLASSPIAPANE